MSRGSRVGGRRPAAPPTATRDARPTTPRRVAVEALAVALLVLACYWALRPDPAKTLGTMYDDVVYVSLGKALAEGQGYRSIHLVGAPLHEKFPPGVPAVYALAWLAGGSLERALALGLAATLVALSAGAGLLWWYCRRALGTGVVTTAVLAIAPLLLARSFRYFAGAVSEPWFLLGWAAALVLTAHATSEAGRDRPLRGAALGLAVGVTALFRTQAVVLLPAVLAALAFRRVSARVVLGALTAGVAPVLAWHLWLARAAGAARRAVQSDQLGYTSWIPHESAGELLHFLRVVVTTNARGYAGQAATVLTGWDSPRAGVALLLVAVAAAAGAWRVRRRRGELWLTLALVLALVLVWPFFQDRFIVPAMPFVGAAAAVGFDWWLAARRRVVRRLALGVMAAGALYLLAPLPASIVRAAASPGARDTAVISRHFQERSRAATEAVRTLTRPSDRVLADVGGLVYLKTGRVTSIAVPEEPYTAPRVFAQPGRYVADRLLADSVSAVLVWRTTGGLLAAQLGFVETRCPGTVAATYRMTPDAAAEPVRLVRIGDRRDCWRALAAGAR